MIHPFRPRADRVDGRVTRAFRRLFAPRALPFLALFAALSALLPVRAATTFFDSFETKPVGVSLQGLTPEIGTGAYAIQGEGTAVTVRPGDDTMADLSNLVFNKALLLFGPAMGAERWVRLRIPGKAGGIPVLVLQTQTGNETSATALPSAWPVDDTWRYLNTAFAGYQGGLTTPTQLDLGALYPTCDRAIPFHFEAHWRVVSTSSAMLDVRIWNGDTPPAFAPGASVAYNLASGSWHSSARSALTGVGVKTYLSAISAYEATPGQSRLVPATDAGISYSGRWAVENGTDRQTAAAGQGFRFFVSGDWCYLRVRGTGDVASAPPISIRLDGGDWRRVEAPSGSDHIIRVYDGDQTPGTHLVEVIVSAAWPGDPWSTLRSRFMLQGLSVAPDAVVSPAPYPARKVLFLGDSISSGHMILSSPLNAGANGRNEARLSAPSLVSDLMGLDVINVSVAGMGFLKPMGQMTALPVLNNTLQGAPWTPPSGIEAVVINLGTNDTDTAAYPDAVLRPAVVEYLQAVRAKLPTARIFMLRPFNAARESSLRGAFDSVADPNSVWVNTAGWLNLAANRDTTDGTHPNVNGAVKYAQKVSELLGAYFATLPSAEITAPAPNAVLTGTVNVTGTAGGYDFTGYRLEVSHINAMNTWTLLADAATPVFGGTLGQWNTTGWASGVYTLRLTVIANGRIATVSRLVSIPRQKGDVDNSGTVTLADAAQALRVAGGMAAVSAEDMPYADAAPQAADGRVTVLDAAAIVRMIAPHL